MRNVSVHIPKVRYFNLISFPNSEGIGPVRRLSSLQKKQRPVVELIVTMTLPTIIWSFSLPSTNSFNEESLPISVTIVFSRKLLSKTHKHINEYVWESSESHSNFKIKT